MAITAVRVHTDAGYIEIIESGALDAAQLRTDRREAATLCRLHGMTRLLVDMREATFTMSTLELYSLGSTARGAGYPRGTVIACVIDTPGEDARFLETVMHNQGYPRFVVVASREEALEVLGVGIR